MAKGRIYETVSMRFAKLWCKSILEADTKGFADPFYLSATDPKCAVLVLRADYREDLERFETTELRAYPPGGVLRLPVTLILKDAQGRAMRRTLT